MIGARLAAALVVVLGVVDLYAAIRPAAELVTSEQLAAARSEVEKHRTPGTIVVHSPLFGVEALSGLGDLSARPDLPARGARAGRRLIVVDHRDHPVSGLGRPKQIVSVAGPVVLRVFEPTGAARSVPIFDLETELSSVRMTVERPPGQVAARCDAPRAEGGVSCPGQPPWLYAAPTRFRVSGREEACVWAHPSTGALVVFELPPLPSPAPGHRLELRLSSALADDATRTPDGDTVRTTVRQGPGTVGQVARSNAKGFAEGRFTVSPDLPIRLEVAVGRDGVRHHCLAAQVIEVPNEVQSEDPR